MGRVRVALSCGGVARTNVRDAEGDADGLVSLLLALAALGVRRRRKERARSSTPRDFREGGRAAGLAAVGLAVLENRRGRPRRRGRPDAASPSRTTAKRPGRTTLGGPRLSHRLRDARKVEPGGERRPCCVAVRRPHRRPFAALSIEARAASSTNGGSRDRGADTDASASGRNLGAHGETDGENSTTLTRLRRVARHELVTGPRRDRQGRGRPSRRVRAKSARAGRTAPVLDGSVFDEEWPGPPYGRGREDVGANGRRVARPADAPRDSARSSRRRAVPSREVTDDSVVAGDEVRLVGKTGKRQTP